MKIKIACLLIVTCLTTRAELPFKLPPKAKYTASKNSISKAADTLKNGLVSDTNHLENLFPKSMVMCGPGLWNLIKDSPHFSKPPLAKSTAKIPQTDGKTEEFPMALLQSETEVASFRRALAELLAMQGALAVRDPNKDEFMAFWAAIPFDKIDEPLLVANGKDLTFICLFEKKGKVFWVDEVKKMSLKK